MTARTGALSIPVAERKPSKGGAVDGRTLVARRRRELIEIYSIALGGPAALSKGQLIDVQRAAELTALAEARRSQALQKGAGDASELSALIRLESTAARAVRALNLPVGGAVAKPQTLADYAARKAAEKVAAASSGDAA